jgi:hypothetical protein
MIVTARSTGASETAASHLKVTHQLQAMPLAPLSTVVDGGSEEAKKGRDRADRKARACRLLPFPSVFSVCFPC